MRKITFWQRFRKALYYFNYANYRSYSTLFDVDIHILLQQSSDIVYIIVYIVITFYVVIICMNNRVTLSFSRTVSAKNPFPHCACIVYAALVVIDDDVQFFIHARICPFYFNTNTVLIVQHKFTMMVVYGPFDG